MVRSAVIFIILAIMNFGCSAKMDSEGHYLIEPVDDPSMLPYRFIVKRKRTSTGSSGSPMLKQYVPVDLYGDGTTGMYSIGNNWRRADNLTAVLFYADTEEKKILSQLNINTTRIASHFPYDFDGDNVIEVAVAYTTRDTLWFEIIDPHQRNICRFPLEVGQDRDGNGFWDGAGVFCGVCDFNNDGYVELLVNCVASYDLYPRKLMCVDWFNKEIRWEYNISGVVIRWHTFIEPSGPTGERFIIFGVKSLGNAAVAGDMNDQHSYLIVLDEHGNLQWKQETGEVFSHSLPLLIDYNSDSNSDILAPFRYDMAHDGTGSQAEHGSGFRIYTADGSLLDSINLGAGRVITGTHLFDLDSDGKQEVFVSLADASILIYDQSLKPVRQARFYSAARVWDYRDFLGNGESQLLVATMDNKLWLLDKGFKPLAQFGEGEDLHYRKSSVYKARESREGFDLIVAGNGGQVNYFLSLVKSPWNTVFFRYPLLAFLAALLPMSLMVALIWFNWHRTRKQKRIISQQRDRLNTALEDLRAAQEKLIAIEQYDKTQDALRVSENRYKTLVENLPQRIFLKDKDSTYVSCNQNYARDLRIKPDEIAGKTDYEFYPKELAEKYRADDKRIVESGKIEDIEERYIQNGQDLWVHTVKTPVKDEKGNIVGVLGIFWDITEHKQAEEALREKEERYALATSAAKVGVWDWDLRSGSFYLDPNIKALLGYEDSEIPNDIEVWTQFIHPDDKDAVMQAASDHLEGRTSAYVFEHRMLHKDGTVRWFMVRGTAIHDASGNVVRMVGTDTDITERKQAEEALRESEAKHRTLVNRLPAITYIAALDETSTTLYISPQVELLLGVTQEEYLRDPDIWLKQLHPNDRERVLREVAQSHDTGEPFSSEYRLIHSNGTVRWFRDQAVIVCDIDEKPFHLQGVMLDITERKKAEEALRSERDFVRSLLDTANSLIVCLDGRARITVFNKECEKVTGYTREEVIGKSWPEIFLPEDHHHHRLKDFAEWVRQHPRDMYEGQLKTKSGQIRTILWSNSALFPSDSDELTAIAIGQDITERKEAERQLQVASQKRYNQVKEIAGGVSHEIFNALFPATSCLNKLSQRLDLNQADEIARNRKLIQVVENAVQRAVEMTELVTEYSKLESDRKVGEVSLQAILQEILLANESRIEELKVKVKLEVSGGYLLKCHRPHVYSLFNNLMVNALDALAEVKQRDIYISACKEGNLLKIEFSDSGAGIPPENIDKIFDAFFSTKPRTGTGLGLAISKKIVELYDGSIEVNSSLDKGTKFIILMWLH